MNRRTRSSVCSKRCAEGVETPVRTDAKHETIFPLPNEKEKISSTGEASQCRCWSKAMISSSRSSGERVSVGILPTESSRFELANQLAGAPVCDRLLTLANPKAGSKPALRLMEQQRYSKFLRPATSGFVLLAAIFALLLFFPQGSPAQSAQPEKTFSREAMLRQIGSNVIAAGFQDLAKTCRDLTNAVGQFAQTTNQVSLDHARKTWIAAADAANRVRCFQAGPIADHGYLATLYYWQVLPMRLEGAADAPDASEQSFIDELGSTTKGLFAVEYLLFERISSPLTQEARSGTALALLSESPTRRALLQSLARDLEAKAGLVAADWASTGDQSALSKFVADGQESVNLLVNQLAMITEDTAEKHLRFVLDLPEPISEYLHRVERSPSSSSLHGALQTMEGFETIYRGGAGLGLDDAIKRVNAGLPERLDKQFANAFAATRAISRPLEQAIVDQRPLIEKAYEEVRALEILFKVDVVSALGVTLTFSSSDGD